MDGMTICEIRASGDPCDVGIRTCDETPIPESFILWGIGYFPVKIFRR